MKKLLLLCSLLLLAINLAIANDQSNQVRVGFYTEKYSITALFTTEEMPEYLEGNDGAGSYVVYKLASPIKTAYQLSHLSSGTGILQDDIKEYIDNFMKSMEDMELNAKPVTYTLLEAPSKGYYSYATKSPLSNGLTIALYTDFYSTGDHLFVVAQLKLYQLDNKKNLEEAKDQEFFRSVAVESLEFKP